MIPTVLLIGLVGAVLLPRREAWVVAAVTAVWTVIVVVEESLDTAGEIIGSVALGAANALVVVGAVMLLRRARRARV